MTGIHAKNEKSAPVALTAEVAGKAITLVKEMGLNQQQAAALLGINQGRVSEVLNGKRFIGAAPYPSDQLSFSF